MKKVLVAGAALLLVGGMAASAMAEVNLSGDARVRWVYKDKYDFGNSDQDATNYFDSRFRVKVNAKSKGGAWMKARIRMDDYKWDGQGWGAYKEDKNIWVDYAYLGIPMGDFTVYGGNVIWGSTPSKFFIEDARYTMLGLKYAVEGVELHLGYSVEDDFVNANDDLEDNNARAFHLLGKFNVNPDWKVTAYGLYVNDDREWTDGVDVDTGEDILVKRDGDNSGFAGTLNVSGKAGALGMMGEIAFVSSDVQSTKNDGWGGLLEVSYDMGGLVPAIQFGFTKDSYIADGDFGWVMIGSTYPLGVIGNVGAAGSNYEDGADWTWIAPTVSYSVSENLKLTGNFVWVNVDTNDDAGIDDDRLAKLYELSGIAEYTVSEGAKLVGILGYLQPDFDGRVDGAGVQDDAALGGMLKMVIKY